MTSSFERNKIRILFLIESLSGGGAEKVLSVLVKYFNYDRYEVMICPIVDTGVYSEEVKRYATYYTPIITYRGNKIRRLWNRIKYKLVYSILPLRWVYRWFIPQKYDVEIAFCEGFLTKLLSYADSKSRKIAWIHTDMIDNPWTIELGVYRNVEEERAAYSVYDKIVCVSQTVEQSFHRKYGLKERTCTIYNPIDVDYIQERAAERGSRDINLVKIISIGRLVPQKGYDRLLKVAKKLHDEGVEFVLEILGEGQERQLLDKYILDNKMKSYVSLLGFCHNPYKYLNNANLFVCSSRAEGFSLVIAEAILLGIPVISTYCSGPNELLADGENGMLVENSEEGLYKGLKAFLNREINIPCVNITEFTKRFDVERIMNELYGIL